MKTKAACHDGSAPRDAQAGVVLIFCLVTLVILLIGAAALGKSFTTGLFNAGNIGFKRDLQNQSERAVRAAMADLNGGALSTPEARAAHRPSSNYSATLLPSGGHSGATIPAALLGDDDVFASVGSAANDIVIAEQQVTVRYLIDRACNATGLDTVLPVEQCVHVSDGGPPGCSDCDAPEPAAAQVVYRLTVRVTGPRNTQAFFQSTFAL